MIFRYQLFLALLELLLPFLTMWTHHNPNTANFSLLPIWRSKASLRRPRPKVRRARKNAERKERVEITRNNRRRPHPLPRFHSPLLRKIFSVDMAIVRMVTTTTIIITKEAINTIGITTTSQASIPRRIPNGIPIQPKPLDKLDNMWRLGRLTSHQEQLTPAPHKQYIRKCFFLTPANSNWR